MRPLLAIATIVTLTATTAFAETMSFDKSWREQNFSLFSSNDYGLKGRKLNVASDGSVSMLYRQMPRGSWASTRAAWDWAVSKGVPATDLRKKGGDDRNLALYFVFLAEQDAIAAEGKGVVKLLRNPAARVLVYVWGGDHPKGAVLPSPYLDSRGKTVVLRGAQTGAFSETVDLASDFKRAFGGAPGALVGLAISADSDDTNSKIVGSLSGLTLK